jgi:hypothetical protein
MATATLVELRRAAVEFLRKIDCGEPIEDDPDLILEEARIKLNELKFQQWRDVNRRTGDGS